MKKSLDDLLKEPEEKQPELTKLEDFKSYLSSLENFHFTTNLEQIVINIASTIEKLSAQNDHLNYYLDEKIKRGYATESDRKQLLSEYKEGIIEVQEAVSSRNNYSQTTDLSKVIDDLPVKVDLKIPEGYRLCKENGILRATTDGRYIQVCPYIILPIQVVNDRNDSTGDMLLRVLRWNNDYRKWIYHPHPVSISKLQDPREITCLNGAGVIAIGRKYNNELASFFVDLINCNNMLTNLPTNEAINSCGWTKDSLFFPFTTQGKDIVLSVKANSTIHSIKNEVENKPIGKLDEAKNIINTLKDNPVFGVMMAGCLAAPLVPKLKGIINENIGIDLHGTTSIGKTTLQIIATSLIFGLGDELKMSWAKTTEAGLWRLAEAINNLPLVADDSHRITDNLAGVPHDVLNRKMGAKSVKIGGEWVSKDTTKDTYTGVVLFNGEVSIISKSPADSAGIAGRVISIHEKPFPPSYSSEDVQNLSAKAFLHAGHYAAKWIEFLSTIDTHTVQDELIEIGKAFKEPNTDGLYGRLSTKASILVYCLKEFNNLFDTSINVDKTIDLLKRSMLDATEQAHVADNIMKRIIDKVFEKVSHYQSRSDDKILMFDYFTNYQTSDSPVNVCYKEGESIIVTNSVLEATLQGTRYNSETVKQTIHSAGYTMKASAKNHKRPQRKGEIKPQMFGYKFKWDKISKFIPQ